MSAPKWTPAQRAAIEDRCGTLLVSAAAGSGKTAVLVERAVRLITDAAHPVAADRLLIVTFTRAAAEELRGRIAVRLAAEAAAHPESAYLRRQRLLLGRANICTIDAFCMQLLKRYFAELGLPPDFELADDAKAYTLRQNALSAVLEELYEDADFCAFASLYGRARSDASAAAAVLGLYDFSRTLPHPAAALQSICAAYESGQPLGQTAWGRTLLENAGRAARSALRLLDAAKGIVAQEPELANYAPALDSDAAFFAALLEYIGAGRWDSAAVYTAEYKPPAFKAVRGYQSPGMNAVKALRAAAKDAAERLKKDVFLCTEAEFEEDRAHIAPMAAALARGAKAFGARLYEDKLAEKALEYSDFEHLALELLCGENGEKTAVARTVSRGFDAVLVDEYQDTNALQALLYQCLANDDGSNLFFVGDVKQSIYRFRLADPTIFLDKYKRFASAETAKEGKERKILLSQNFRSRKEILDAANFVFANILSTEMGEMEYGEDEMLHFGAAYYPERTDCDTEFHLIAAHQRSEEETRPVKKLLAEARFTARRIRQLLDEGYPVTGEEGTLRPCRPEDIVILMRSPGSRSAVFAQALAEEDVPCSFEDSGDYFQSMEISVTVSLLEIIDNPRQDVPLISVLRSPIFGFTPDRLAEIRSCDREGDFYDALRADTGVDSQNFLQVLTQLRETAMDISVCQLLWHIYDRLALPGIFGAMEGGALRQENLMALSRYAEHFEANDYRGLFAFITQLRRLLDAGNAPAVKTTGGSGGVQMMSIHKSKGLEFPIVFLCDLDHSFSNQDFDTPVLVHPTLGLGPHCIDLKRKIRYPTMARLALEETLRRENLAEEQRVLYVAMTRPKEKLILVASMYHTEKRLQKLTAYAACPALPEAVAEGRCFGDWILLPLLCRPEAAPLRERAGVEVESLYTGDTSPWQVFIHDANDYGEAPKKEMLQAENASGHTEFDPAVLNYRYPYQRETQLPAKLTATQLKGRALDEEIAEDALHTPYIRPLSQPKFRQQDRGLTPAERGTATHLVLQYLDLRNPNVPEQVAALRLRAKLTPEQAAAVDIRALERFLSSPLAEEMRRVAAMEREYRFTVLMDARDYDGMSVGGDEILLQGVVDCWFETPDGLTVVDFKTDRVFTEEELTERAELYRGQLSAYTLALERVLERPVTRRVLYFLSVGRAVEVS